jgi:hypothetical protein
VRTLTRAVTVQIERAGMVLIWAKETKAMRHGRYRSGGKYMGFVRGYDIRYMGFVRGYDIRYMGFVRGYEP